MRLLVLTTALAAAFAAGCGGESSSSTGSTSGGSAGTSFEAGVGGSGGSGAAVDAGVDSGFDAGCSVNSITLFVESDPESPTRYWVPVDYQGKPAALGVDTGSSLTFLYLPPGSPEYVPHAGDLTIGCETLPVPGRNIDLGGEINGLKSVGLLGADFFLSRTVELDAKNETLTRFASGTQLPATQNWSSLPFENVKGHVIAPITLDSKPLRMMFDTGSPDIVWLGEPARPGDTEVVTQDASGTLLTFYQGPSTLEMASEPPREIDVLRAPSWPYFETIVEALGGNINGLVGLNAFAWRKLLFQADQQVIRIAPE